MRFESGRSSENRPGGASAAVTTANELYLQGKLSETVSFIHDHMDLEEPEALFLLAKAFTKLQNYKEAQTVLRRILKKTDFKSTPKRYEVQLF
jgi:Flp pilus assembly protein TadD